MTYCNTKLHNELVDSICYGCTGALVEVDEIEGLRVLPVELCWSPLVTGLLGLMLHLLQVLRCWEADEDMEAEAGPGRAAGSPGLEVDPCCMAEETMVATSGEFKQLCHPSDKQIKYYS